MVNLRAGSLSGRQWHWRAYELWRRFDRWFRRESVRRRFFFTMSLLSAIGLFMFVLHTLDYLNQASPRQEYDDLQFEIRRRNIQARIRQRLWTSSPIPGTNCTSDAFLDDENYPECREKMAWMRQFWQSEKCYAQNGVDGTDCSFSVFLSEVQHFCPVLPWRKVVQPRKASMSKNQTDINGLFELMADNPVNFQWMKGRLTRMWPTWSDALKQSTQKDPSLFEHRRLTIMLHLGFLSKETGLNFGTKSAKGGPLGELVQWSDLIASLYLLGHKLIISTETVTFRSTISKMAGGMDACNSQGNNPVDLIFTDIMGLRMMRRKVKKVYSSISCRVRVLDSFGTHAEFNSNEYFLKHRSELGGKTTNTWGGHQLKLGQFLTMYPHTDDNTFLGFVVELHDRATSVPVQRENISLVYGKENYMWEGMDSVLDVLKEFTPIHATVADGKAEMLKKWDIVNHHLLNGPDFHSLLRKTKIFFGLGFPLEGPAPLEAIANGAVFINPKFVPPKSRRSYKFFADKPTLRELTSQNPYVERFVGEPLVYTVDLSNKTSLRKVLSAVLNISVHPYLPYEFTAPGMLERVHILTSHHNFCTEKHTWPPFSSARIIQSGAGLSCQEACAAEGLLCERTFFWRINNPEEVTKFGHCSEARRNASLTYAPTSCLLQQNPLLYSCASKPPTLVQRICPCRSFKEGQSILCKDCT
ncbi:hypothetical protein QR680_008994 [Steinernema hermaphroditum]|uniref:alpha-1,6-mannosyl-glycoprotein 6-beta-N-acetylglucosaminyltransferase n=1 Tax=Steinernema hermaphroditum TaxID=289476 RepID=A0AA39IIM4_9BILA|nr:hypothetical protein QR680_008994 [Steinernema hermaphroditum]